MKKYYTRACNFYFGPTSQKNIRKKISLPLNGSDLISFDKIEIINDDILNIDEKDKKKAEEKVNEMCKKLLANLVIEDYKIIGFQ